jgi:hypothetical protein
LVEHWLLAVVNVDFIGADLLYLRSVIFTPEP